MRYLIVCLLLLTGTGSRLLAQLEPMTQPRHTRTERLFNVYQPFVNNIHTAHFLKNEKMVIELADLTDYDMLDDLTTVLRSMVADIAFYRDSIPASGNVRIDYIVTEDSHDRIMRFKKYPTDGDIFVKQNGDVARLILDQDTIHITLQKKPNDRSNHAHFYDFPAQVTFVLNHYYNIDTFLANTGFITAVVDTMRKAITPKKTNPESHYPLFGIEQSAIDYYPFSTDNKMRRSSVVLPHGDLDAPRSYKPTHVAAYGNIGAGLIRNTLTPVADAGITLIRFHSFPFGADWSFTSFYASAAFFFAANEKGDQVVRENYFINIESGTNGTDDDFLGLRVRSISLGAGYLFSQNGDYFKPVTLKAFMGFRLQSGITLLPEIIATNNFRQIFPGITLKVFGFKREPHKRSK